MSDLENLKSENESLKQQVVQGQAGLEGVLAQLDAHRESLNEALNSGLTLRTNVVFLKKQNEKLSALNEDLKKQLAGVNAQLEDATKKIDYLQNPV